MTKLLKILLKVVGIIAALFLVTFGIYFFNLDMKATALIEPFLLRHYDKMPRNAHL